MTEDQDLMAKISQLAGQINRHKNQQPHSDSPYTSEIPAGQYASRHVPARGRGWAPYRGRQYPRGRAVAAPHRHRTLILNNTTTSGTPGSTPSAGAGTDTEGETNNKWVAKRDRHMQLINSAIYDKEAQSRAKAMEESRKAKSQKKAQIEQARVLRYAQGHGRMYQPTPGFAAPPPSVATTAVAAGDPAAAAAAAEYQVLVNEVPFRVARGGSKLIRVSDDPNTANNTPKRVTIAGVVFVRSKNGNLHRLGAVTSKRKPMAVKKKDALCQRFTTTGSCYKGPLCPYAHDPNKVAICKDFLQTGNCNSGMSCDLSHEPSPHRSPACVHFLRGRCSNPECRYAHVRVTPGAPVCRDFAILGYCEKGAECDQRHVHECPDYANTGLCNKKSCRLPHVDRAGQIRKNAAATTNSEVAMGDDADEESDASSDDEEYDEIDSDDVDSDDLEDDEPELITAGADVGDLARQQDFVPL
ncbi:CCCH zinc finger protein [Aspergillus homomorphus CBS 101889]|uniref:C3H1-type domain-containing protein n=1 Tax=Aspergillus homomorphus (strain CBS 101889) TaxID=1450537 RepID=A0A395HQ98_ASPHC|nr:hypothetical protein BO97DRAFT_395348 [Aspergillus homomorphus CBS 101889]RAL09786.1 hypothetical protein BO97DRAFT_395348 [Aspergillus homomorphus CBS 101889]